MKETKQTKKHIIEAANFVLTVVATVSGPPIVSNFLSFCDIHSDVSGGYSPSMFNAMRVAIHASKALSLNMNQTTYRPLTHHEAFYLATMGGAQG